jgi:uncharacterized membrane protein YhaH (DUF805 family)
MISFLFSPSGRIGRARWWIVQSISLVLLCIFYKQIFLLSVAVVLAAMTASFVPIVQVLTENSTTLVPLLLFSFWLQFCATVKRYHDRGKSGWWFLINFLPYIGSFWIIIECGFMSGELNDNEYGLAGGGNGYTPSSVAFLGDEPEVGERYEQAIQAALAAQKTPSYSSPGPQTHSQQYYDRPRDNKPVFGKRV